MGVDATGSVGSPSFPKAMTGQQATRNPVCLVVFPANTTTHVDMLDLHM